MAVATPWLKPQNGRQQAQLANLQALAAVYILLESPPIHNLDRVREAIDLLMDRGNELGLTERDIVFGLLKPIFLHTKRRCNCISCLATFSDGHKQKHSGHSTIHCLCRLSRRDAFVRWRSCQVVEQDPPFQPLDSSLTDP